MVKNKALTRFQALLLITVMTVAALFTGETQAAALQFSASQTQTGGIVGLLNTVGDDYCPTATTPGCDFSNADNIVRSNDDIEFQFNVSVGPAGDGPIILTTELDPGLLWPTLPSSCDVFTSTITGDGTAANPSILNCDLGTRAAWASTFNITARAMGDNPNGTTAGITSASIDAPNSTRVDLAVIPPDVIITASPRMNLKKQYRLEGPVTVGSEVFLRVQYTWWIESWKHDLNGNTADDPDPKLGNEMIDGPVTFIEDPSTVSPNAYLHTCNRVNATAYPYETYNATYPERSVLNAGTVSCSNTGPTATGPVTVTVTGADFSLTHVPTETRGGSSLSSDRGIASFGTFYIYVPVSDITAAGGSISSVNTLSGFDPVSITGISNLDEDLSDNTVARELVAQTGSWNKLFRHSVPGEQDADKVWYSPPTTATGNWAGDGMVQRNQTFATSTTFNNRSFAAVDEVEICDVIDASLYEFSDLDSTPGVAHKASNNNGLTNGTEGVDYSVEYGIGYVGTWPPTTYPNPGALEAECTDPSVQWFSNLTNARAAGTPTKLRVKRLTPQPIGSGNLVIKHRVRSDITAPNGTLLTNMATHRSTFTGMEWRDCNYVAGAFPTPTQVSDACGDRLTLTQSLARIVKTTVPDDFIDVVQAGGTIRYQLAPNFTSVNAISDNITVVDNLPAGVSYATNSAVWNGTPAEPTVTGSAATGQTLMWDLGTWDANDPIPVIQFDVNIPITAANGTILDNSATILATTDGSSVEQRSDTRRISVSSPSSIILSKNTNTPLKDQNELFRFNMEYYNGTPNDVPTIDLIDILPYNGDNRTPASSFSGSYVINPVTFESNNATVYYTNLAPQSIANDPQDDSNDLPGGSTQWCTAAQFGSSGCPAGYSNVTAFRLIDQNILQAGDSRTLSVEFTPSGNFGGEVYTNIAQVSGEGVGLSAYSPYATTRVIEKPALGLAKNLTTQNGVDLGFSFLVQNLGNTHLASLNIIDDLDATFGAGNYSITSMPVVTVQPATGGLTASTTFTGTGGETNLLDPAETNSLPSGTQATLTLGIKILTQADMGNGLGVYDNSATTEGTTPSGGTTDDTSDNGLISDANNNGIASDTDEDDPTPIVIPPFDRSDTPVDGSTAPNTTDTTSYGSPIHTVIEDIHLGANNDVDPAAIGSATATGDGTDDDGINWPELIPGTQITTLVTVNQTVASEGYLQGWIDWNGNGDFSDAGEQIVTDLQLATGTTGTINIPITVPATATTLQTFARFRWSSTETLDSTSPANDGEVEDYVVNIVEKTPDVLTRPGSCESYNEFGWLTPGGPYVNDNINFGSGDPERDPLVYAGLYKDFEGRVVTFFGPSTNTHTNALSDAARYELNQDNPTAPGPYVSEYHASVYKLEGTPSDTVTVKFTSQGGADNIYAWIEDSASTVITTATDFVYGTFNEVSLTFTYPADGVVYLYGTIFDPSANYGATKIEGYVCPRDYGDAPDTYGTTLAADGARHGIKNDVYLGSGRPDIDVNVVPGAAADSDDTNSATNDEEGVAIIPSLSVLDSSYRITVNATNATSDAGRLIAWIDFDGNGTFDADEAAARVIPSTTAAGDFVMAWASIPSDIQTGATYLRLRFTTDSLNAGEATGAKSDGEVEDYPFTIISSGVNLSGRVYIDANSSAGEDPTELGIGGTVVVLRNTSTNVCRSVRTSGSGHYSFTGVSNGSYEVYQAHGETTPLPQNCGTAFANNPTGYQSTTPDILIPSVSGVDVIDQDFGEVAGTTSTTGVNTGTGITFEPDHQSEVLPGNVAFYAHVFTTEADGSVSFNAESPSNKTVPWSGLLYWDKDCNGALNGAEGNSPIANMSFGVDAGGRFCIINKVYAPANAPARDQYRVETTATFTYAGGNLAATTLSVTDLTITGQPVAPANISSTAVGESALELRKTVQNITTATPKTATSNEASPGNELKYSIYYRNTGTGPINDLIVNDSLPAYTELVPGSQACEITPPNMTCTPTVSGKSIDWTFVGTLEGGASGNVSYRVLIDK